MTLCPGGTESIFAKVAGPGIKYDSSKSESPEVVAEKGLEVFLKGELSVITGKGNQTIAMLPRFISRKKILKIVGGAWKKTLGLS